SDSAGGLMIRTTPADAQSVDIAFLDERGADLSPSAQRKLERVFSRQEFRRAFPGEIAELTFPSRILEDYSQEVLRCIDTSGVPEAGLKVVIDTAGGTAALVLPALLGRIGVDVLTVNNRLDETSPTETLTEHMRALDRLGELVASSGAAFGVRFDPVGERISLVDERGMIVHDDRALLVLMDLVAAERHSGSIALPITTTRIAEDVARFHHVTARWAPTSPDELTKAASAPDVIFAGDGRGGFVIPEFDTAIDGIAAFVRLTGLVARTMLTLSQIDARIPQAHVLRRSVQTPWAAKGMVMRSVVEAAGDRQLDTTDGVRVVEDDGRWVLVLPDPAEAVTHLWAESGSPESAAALLDAWVAVIEGAGS
ncbi:MAG: mannose-1-phosphate guanyltransferase, partial [Gaiellaceae bacterium]